MPHDDVASTNAQLPSELLETIQAYVTDLAVTTLDVEEARLTVYVEAWFAPFDMATVGFTILLDGRVVDDEKQTLVLNAMRLDMKTFADR